MKDNRKTSQDLRTEYVTAVKKLHAIDNGITAKLQALATAHPDAVIEVIGDVNIKAINISHNSQLIGGYDVETRLKYIKGIEDYLLSLQPYVQTQMFNENK